MIADRLEASLCQADSVDVDALVTGPNTLTVDGLRVSGALSGVSNTSCDEVEVGGARQWAGGRGKEARVRARSTQGGAALGAPSAQGQPNLTNIVLKATCRSNTA